MYHTIDIGADIVEPDSEPPNLLVDDGERTPLENFGQMLRVLRRQKALSPIEFAARAGLSPQLARSIETGQADFDEVLQALPDLSAGLGVTCRLLSTALFDFGFRN